MEDDWDLQAVVKSYTTTTPTATSIPDLKHDSSVFPPPSKITQNESVSLPCFPDSFETRGIMEELHQLHNPFLPKSQPISLLNGFRDQLFPKSNRSCGDFVSIASVSTSARKCSQSSSRSKRRKNQMKKVCQVTAEGVSSDVWSWRKYGQKPIKGSPFPRGYYKCSSSKGCLARKQVERNKSDPTMFIVTYTSEHNHPVPAHRNSLAGVTRNPKPPSLSSPATDESPVTTTSTDNIVDDQEEDDNNTNVGFSEIAVTDDFFEGLEKFSGPVTGEFFSDHLPASFSLPWIAGSS